MRRRIDREAEARREPHGAQHAQPILGDARARVADGPDGAGGEIGAATDEVDDLVGERIPVERIDGEVAALRVLLGRAEVHGDGPATVDVGVVGAKRRHLDPLVPQQDEHHAELHAHRDGAREERAHDLGRRARRHVVICRRAAEQPIANAAAGEVGRMARVAQPADDASRALLAVRRRHT
jgi:hypothetical protein